MVVNANSDSLIDIHMLPECIELEYHLDKVLVSLNSSTAIGYSRINLHASPVERLHLTILGLKPRTSIIWHKSTFDDLAYYQVLRGELELCLSDSLHSSSTVSRTLRSTMSPLAVRRCYWRRLTNHLPTPVFYVETCLGPHTPSSTKWNS